MDLSMDALGTSLRSIDLDAGGTIEYELQCARHGRAGGGHRWKRSAPCGAGAAVTVSFLEPGTAYAVRARWR